jgi:hypothetical protein
MLKSVIDGSYLFDMLASHVLVLLAELTVQTIGGWLAAVLVGGGGLWILFLLMVRGFWDKTGKPAIKDLIVALHAEPEYVKKQREEIQSVIQTWHNEPEQLKVRIEFVKGVIDNEVRRDDGVIHRDITTKVTALEAALAKKIDDMAVKFDHFQESQEQRDKENREFSTQVLAKLARIEGAFQTMTNRRLGGTGESYTSLPAQRPSKPGSSGSSSEG